MMASPGSLPLVNHEVRVINLDLQRQIVECVSAPKSSLLSSSSSSVNNLFEVDCADDPSHPLVGLVQKLVANSLFASSVFVGPTKVGLVEVMEYVSGGSCPPHVDCIDGYVALFAFGESCKFHYEQPHSSSTCVTFASGDVICFRGSAVEGLKHWIDDVTSGCAPQELLLTGKRIVLQLRRARDVSNHGEHAIVKDSNLRDTRHFNQFSINQGSPFPFEPQSNCDLVMVKLLIQTTYS
jgi:hypothetical protein